MQGWHTSGTHLALAQRAGAAFGGGGADEEPGGALLLFQVVGGKGLGGNGEGICVYM